MHSADHSLLILPMKSMSRIIGNILVALGKNGNWGEKGFYFACLRYSLTGIIHHVSTLNTM